MNKKPVYTDFLNLQWKPAPLAYAFKPNVRPYILPRNRGTLPMPKAGHIQFGEVAALDKAEFNPLPNRPALELPGKIFNTMPIPQRKFLNAATVKLINSGKVKAIFKDNLKINPLSMPIIDQMPNNNLKLISLEMIKNAVIGLKKDKALGTEQQQLQAKSSYDNLIVAYAALVDKKDDNPENVKKIISQYEKEMVAIYGSRITRDIPQETLDLIAQRIKGLDNAILDLYLMIENKTIDLPEFLRKQEEIKAGLGAKAPEEIKDAPKDVGDVPEEVKEAPKVVAPQVPEQDPEKLAEQQLKEDEATINELMRIYSLSEKLRNGAKPSKDEIDAQLTLYSNMDSNELKKQLKAVNEGYAKQLKMDRERKDFEARYALLDIKSPEAIVPSKKDLEKRYAAIANSYSSNDNIVKAYFIPDNKPQSLAVILAQQADPGASVDAILQLVSINSPTWKDEAPVLVKMFNILATDYNKILQVPEEKKIKKIVTKSKGKGSPNEALVKSKGDYARKKIKEMTLALITDFEKLKNIKFVTQPNVKAQPQVKAPPQVKSDPLLIQASSGRKRKSNKRPVRKSVKKIPQDVHNQILRLLKS